MQSTMNVHGVYDEIKKQRSLERWQQQGIEACLINHRQLGNVHTMDFEPGNMTRYSMTVARLPHEALLDLQPPAHQPQGRERQSRSDPHPRLDAQP